MLGVTRGSAGRWLAVLVVVGAATLSAACEDSTGPLPVASVEVSPKEGVWSGTIVVGQSITLAAKSYDASGGVLPAGLVTWTTTDSAIAVVNQLGIVQARRAGNVEVLATIDGRTGRIFVNVVAPPQVVSVRVSPLGAVLQVGQTRQYIVRLFDANEDELFGRTVSWSTTSPDVVSVSQDGMVRGLAPGYGDVIATVEGRVGVSAVTVPTPEPDGQ